MMANALQGYGIEALGPLTWIIGDETFDLSNQHGLYDAVHSRVRQTLWVRLARNCTSYQGLSHGKDEGASLAWRSTSPPCC